MLFISSFRSLIITRSRFYFTAANKGVSKFPLLPIWLLGWGVEPNMPNKDGRTPIDLISDDSLKDIFTCLSKNSESPVFIQILLKLSDQPVHKHLCVVITACKRICGKVMFLHVSVCWQWGRVVPYLLGPDPPQPPRRNIEPDRKWHHTPPPPEPQKRAVRILLECFLVLNEFVVPNSSTLELVRFGWLVYSA